MADIRTEGIKYAGSKLKLLPYIGQVIAGKKDVRTVFDGFSGTTRVSQAFAQWGRNVTSNDVSAWSEVFASCYLLSRKPDEYYSEILEYLNTLEGYDGWYTQHYGGEENETKFPFQKKNTRRLDAIRDEIERLGLAWVDKCVLLTSLIKALDRVDSTLGHHVSYLKNWSRRSYNDMVLKVPERKPGYGSHEVLRGDVFEALKGRKFDLAYLDPPYGSNNEKMPPSRVRYASYYHLWTSLVLHDKPMLFGRTGRRADSRDNVACSAFEEFRRDKTGCYIAIQAIRRLIHEVQARYVLLSYSSGGRATKQELCDVLESEGRLKQILEIDYKRNVMAAMTSTRDWAGNREEHKEYLFLLEK